MSARFWKPGTEKPGSQLQEERATENHVIHNPNSHMSIERQKQKLPIFYYRNHLLYLIEKYQTVVVIGETGCGKSTQLPQYLYEAGWAAGNRVIAVTEPRRVAAVTLANRVADERASTLGHEVGYLIRFEDCRDTVATRVCFMTDGMLVRELMQDPLLTRYSVVMLDEAHERTLHTDIALGLLKKVLKKRKDLRLIVASATLDAEKFRDFFNLRGSSDASNENEEENTSVIITVEGRMYPVDVHHVVDPVPNYITATVDVVLNIHRREKEGDILCFLTGQEDILRVIELLIEHSRQQTADSMKMRVLPMYSGLPAAEQMKVFDRLSRHTRKIVVATNIAEASVTINGIVYVVDCGFVKLPAFNPHTGIETLAVVPISQASATQRAGRAGRVRSGKAYRLYPENEYDKLAAGTVPEIQRSNLASVILQLKALGISNVVRFDFLSSPPAQNMLRGVELLYALGAIDDNCNLTDPLGMQMAEFPLNPFYSKMLLASQEYECSQEIAIVAAMMQINNVFITPSKQKVAADKAKRLFAVEEGDHLTMVNVFTSFLKYKRSSKWCREHMLNYKGLCRALEIYNQLTKLLQRFKIQLVSCEGKAENIQRCIVAGFFSNAARLHYSGEYRTVRDDHPLHIHPTSVLYSVDHLPQWVVFNEVVQTSKDFMRDITVINPQWLYTVAPHYYQYGTDREIAAKRFKTA